MPETPDRDSATVRAALKKWKQKRAANSAQKRKEGEDLKDMGNGLFKKGDYEGAVILYSQVIERAGPKPVYLSNLSAAYMKLADYESAEWGATGALLYDPKLIKARYRRALARKKMNLLKAAMSDLKTILVHDSGCIEAQKLLDIVQNDWEAGDGIELEDGYSTDDQA
ncbi:hypothetical protein BDQ12DRAFT_739279 [Crucibulum laeve]|uniref:Uncharacterized protein n=1 Tax=Crucibulum laeve TaxID=68775 RepID=A0A5C3LID8_9AGAR|nr:hypothetical protein BDQ12DRAFT_739279 [Crucibulum laeve]